MARTRSTQHRTTEIQPTLVDAAYAVVGLGNAVAGTARTLPRKLSEVRVAPGTVNGELRKLRGRAEREFAILADRGRTVVGATRGATKASAAAVESNVRAAGAAADRDQLAAMTVEELRDLAARKDVGGRSGMTKDQLIAALARA